jgi:hypothetical protein
MRRYEALCGAHTPEAGAQREALRCLRLLRAEDAAPRRRPEMQTRSCPGGQTQRRY